MKYAPIIISTLYRIDHLIRLIESLKRNSWARFSDLYIGLDFPPSEKYKQGWQEICDYLDNADFSVFASLTVVRREINYGYFRNSHDLLSRIFEKFDRVIELADDLEVSPNYIEYMDKCLDAFEDDPDIVMITGYTYPIAWQQSPYATCMKQNFNAAEWGRATWKKKYLIYSKYINSGQLLSDLPRVIANQSYKKMIDACLCDYLPAATAYKIKENYFFLTPCDVAMRAYLAVEGKYCISPIISKVRNYGFDGSGLYCQNIARIDNLTASTYDYNNQEIDESDSFNVVLNDDDYMDENRYRLNVFDYRPEKQLKNIKLLLFIIETYGIWAGQLFVLYLAFMSKIRHLLFLSRT